MRDECERIADVLQQFFTGTEYGYAQKKAEEEIIKFRDKSEKAKKAVEARWSKQAAKPVKAHTDVLRNGYECNTNHKPLTNNHKPIKRKAFTKPTQVEIGKFSVEEDLLTTGFYDYYESNGWKVGKNSMKDWKAALRGWSKRQATYNNKTVIAMEDLNFDSKGYSQ